MARIFSRRGMVRQAPVLMAGLCLPHRLLASLTDKEKQLIRRVPFFSARSDISSTLACARMALSYFEPQKNFTVSRVSEMIYYKPGCWTFEAQLMPMLSNKGYRVKLHTDTPYEKIARGEVTNRYGKDASKFICQDAVSWALSDLSENNFGPSGADLKTALQWHEKGELIMIGVSRRVLRNSPGLGYCRYNLIICGRGEDSVYVHDPCGGPYRKISRDLLEQACADSGSDRAVLRVRRL